MKIIKSGLAAKDGIHLTCQYCQCEFLVEDKKDWEIQELIDLNYVPFKRQIEYGTRCPECHVRHIVGCNPNKCAYNLISPYKIIFDREDWEERYEIKNEEDN